MGPARVLGADKLGSGFVKDLKKMSLFVRQRKCIGKMITDDMALLVKYAHGNSEEAFAALVSRHIHLVYSIALRQVLNPQLAEEVTQAVFVILARKSASLSPKTILSGWLCRTARNVSANALTVERRRRQHEQEASMESLSNKMESPRLKIEPLLETAMSGLSAKDHDALVLRFFEGHNFRELSLALGVSEEAAKKRVNRALEKLRVFFARHGVAISTSAILGALSANSVQSAPISLVASVSAAAGKSSGMTTSALALATEALKYAVWTKLQTAAVAAIAALVIAGAATVSVLKLAETQAPPGAAGYGTPEAAVQTAYIFMSRGDTKNWLASYSPAEQESIKARFGSSETQLRAAALSQTKLYALTQITGKEVISSNEVRFHIRGPPPISNQDLIVKKIGGQWKVAGAID